MNLQLADILLVIWYLTLPGILVYAIVTDNYQPTLYMLFTYLLSCLGAAIHLALSTITVTKKVKRKAKRRSSK